MYAEGVGLGASKGKEVGKYGDGYSGYVSMAQDAVIFAALMVQSIGTHCTRHYRLGRGMNLEVRLFVHARL